jgi:WD40 repeat protein
MVDEHDSRSSFLRRLLVVTLWLALGATASAQSGGTGPLPRKDPVIEPDRIAVKPGTPLSVRALVTTPAPLKGAVGWSVETREHRGRFSVAALSPDGKLVATGGIDGTIRLWNLATGKLVRALIGHDSYVHGLAFSPAGKYLASGGAWDRTARIWEVETGRPVKVLTGHPDYLGQVAWTLDGTRLVGAGGYSGDVSIWEIATGIKRAKAAVGSAVTSFAIHPDGTRLAIVTRDSPISFLDLKTGKAQGLFGNGTNLYTALDWSPDGKRLAATSSKSTDIHDASTGAIVATLDGQANAQAWTSDGARLAVASWTTGTIRVWKPEDKSVTKLATYATWLQFLPSNDQLAVADTIGFGQIDAAADGKAIARHEVTGTAPPYWTSGRPAITGIGTKSLTLWDPANGKPLRTLEGHRSPIAAFAWSTDGKGLATASSDQTVRVWNPATGAAVHVFSKHTEPVVALAWSPDGKEIATAAEDKRVLIWDAKSGALTQTLPPFAEQVPAIAWAPDSKTLAVGVKDGLVHLFPRATWKVSSKLTAPSLTTLSALAWSADSKAVAAGDYNGVTIVWFVAGSRMIAELPRSGSPPLIRGLVFYPKGDVLAVSRGNYTLDLWPLKGKVTTVQTMAPPEHLAWSAYGPLVAVSSTDRTCRFLEPATGKLRGVLLAEPEQLVAVSADGHHNAEAAAEHLVYVVQTQKGQDTYSAAAFLTKHGWRNNSALARFASK